MDEELDTRYCFRCKGLAVIDMAHLTNLIHVLHHTRYLLINAKFESEEENEKAWGLGNSLEVYANILDSISVD